MSNIINSYLDIYFNTYSLLYNNHNINNFTAWTILNDTIFYLLFKFYGYCFVSYE